MKKILAICMAALDCALSTACAATLCSGNSAPTFVDLTSGIRTASPTETILYSTVWETDASGAEAVIAVNGEMVNIASGSGVFTWQPAHNGTYVLTHRVVAEGRQVGETLAATFEFRHWPETQTSPEPVPYAWLREYFPEIADEHEAYESAALATASNGVNKVWECYLAGLDPTNSTDRLFASISIGEGGSPSVSWTPDLGTERDYFVEGKASLADKWGAPDGGSRFFRVHAAMPGAFHDCTLSFDTPGGSVVPSITADYGEALIAPEPPTKAGYTFSGWSPPFPATMPQGGAILAALWTTNNYSVAFHANGGSGSMADESFAYDAAQALTANGFMNTGYVFSGWATSPDGPKVFDDGQNVSNLTSTAGASVDLYAVWTPATYCVIDLSAGADASSYPVTYLAEPPSGSFNVDEYKTTKLVLKRIEAGSFQMGDSKKDVTLTKPFFMALFETTQKQYKLVTGDNPSSASGEMLPVEKVSYNAIRGSTDGAQWPASNAVDADSFLGKLRARTGLDFDLPTEAQWEYACRAGTTTSYSFGDSADGNYMWYTSNSSSKTHEVGTKLPNPWGLYDMHGNVNEWCLDWYNTYGSLGGTDPKGSSSGNLRIERGGSCYSYLASYCTSSSRDHDYPSEAYYHLGFRLARTLKQ